MLLYMPICQDNPSDKDINQGTLVLFNLDSSVSNDELSKTFGSYGEIKEVSHSNCSSFSFYYFALLLRG